MSGIMSMVLGAKTAIAAAVDAYFNLVTLLLPGDGTNGAQNNTFLDSSTNNFTITRNGNTTQGTFSPFSQTGWSNYFPNTYLSAAANNAFSFGTGNFTIEAWVYPTVGSVYRGIFANGGASTGSFAVYLTNGDTVRLDYYGGGGVGTTTTVALNTWSHIVVARSGSTISIFINGTRQATTTTSDNNTSNACYVGASWGGASDYMQGYMSNLRVVKGTAVYDPTLTTLTVPTAALTAVSGTSLLTCQSNRFIDNSSNAFAITVNGTPSVQAFSPFAPTAAYSAATNGGSGYFDGSGDYLTFGANSAFTGTDTFTIEAFVYPTLLAGNYRAICNKGYGSTGEIFFGCDGVTPVVFLNSSGFITGSTTMRLNEWNHIALVRNVNSWTLYLNGASIGTGTNSSSFTGTGLFSIGGGSDGSYPWNGYISGVRIAKSAVYTGSYTVPTAPPTTSATNTTFLANFTNAGITDATAKNVLETVGNAQISTTQSKFGGSSMYFDGTGDALLIPRPNMFDFGSGDFTIECWFYYTNTNQHGIFTTRSTSAQYAPVQIQIESSNVLKGYASTNGSSWAVNITASTSPTTNTWYHVAFVRSGTTFTLYLNGVSVGTATGVSGALTTSTLYGAVVGAQAADLTNPMNGYIDDLRITKGYARYTANFTAPTAAFPTQ